MYGPKFYRFSLHLNETQLLEIYSGHIRRVRVTTDEGLVVEIDAQHLKEFTTKQGITGKFKLTVSRHNKFIALEKTD